RDWILGSVGNLAVPARDGSKPLGEPPAVDVEIDTRHIRGRIGREEDHRAREVVGNPPAPENGPRRTLLAHPLVAPALARHVGSEVARADGVDADAGTEVERERLGELLQGALEG